MNRLLRIMGMTAMVLLLIVSCKKEKQNDSQGAKMVTLTAGIEQANSKIHMNIANTTSYWDDGDEILVNGNKLTASRIYAENTMAEFKGLWNGDGPKGVQLYAIYPALEQQANGEKAWKSRVKLPKEQNYYDNDVKIETGWPMGVSDYTTSLSFHNLANVYGIPVYTKQGDFPTITKVTMEKITDPDNEYVGGIINESYGNDTYPLVADIWYPHTGTQYNDVTIYDESASSYTITLNCSNGGVRVSSKEQVVPDDPSNSATEFFFAAYPVQLPYGIIFTFYHDDDVVSKIYKNIGNNKIDNNRFYDMVPNPDPNDRTAYRLPAFPPTFTDNSTLMNGTNISFYFSISDVKLKGEDPEKAEYGYQSATQYGDYYKLVESVKLGDFTEEPTSGIVASEPGWYRAYIKTDAGVAYGNWRHIEDEE